MKSFFMLEVALTFYVKHGLAIFPCARKKPLTENGFKDATADEAAVREWWARWPKAQIGLPCGARNHLLVVDSDGPRGNEWIKKQNWPHTLTVETSPGHFQLYFRQPEGIVTKPSAGQIAPQIDVRGDGSYVIGAFSFHHRTHKPYIIVRDISGTKETGNPMLPWAEAPASLLALVTVNGTAPTISGGSDTIPQGQRHAKMLALAGGLRARGFSPETVLTDLRVVNERQCKPPLPDAELQKMAQYLGTKPPGFRGQQRPLETSAEVETEVYADVKREKIRWLWEKRIARGKLNLDVGDPGLGKSLATCDMAARVSNGTAFPDGAECEAGDVLILSAEDDPQDTIGPRLAAAGADLSRVHRVKCVKVILPDGQTGESSFNLERDLEKLDEKLDKLPRVLLLIIDPLSAYMGQRIDTHVDAAVRSVLAPLADFAARRNIAVVGVMHLRKSEASALLRVSGSIGFAAAARIIWGFGVDPDNPDRRIMVPVKNNLAAMGQGLAYRIAVAPGEDAPRLEWLKDEVTLSPDEVLNSDPRHRRARAHRQEHAEEWLKELLANGPVPQQRVENAAVREQFSWRTVLRAKAALRVRSTKTGFRGCSFWELPEERDG